jgi:hypothetical protein
MHLKKAVAFLFVLIFAAAMFHFFYGEDHCPSRFPSAGGGFGLVHHHHGNASTCLGFLSGLFGPETADWDGAADLHADLAQAGESRVLASLGTGIFRPPNFLLA